MAPSQVFGTKMRNLLFGVILGLLAVVQSTPLTTVPQDDVVREALTDGYIIDQALIPSLTTEPPKRNTTVQGTQQPASELEENDRMEGSGGTDDNSVTMFPQHGGHSSSDSSTTQGPDKAMFTESDMMEGSADAESTTFVFPQHRNEEYETTTALLWEGSGDEDGSTTFPMHVNPSSSTTQSPKDQSSVTPDYISVAQTTDPAVSTTDLLSPGSGSGSGDGNEEMQQPDQTTSSSTTTGYNPETTTASPTTTAALIDEVIQPSHRDIVKQGTPIVNARVRDASTQPPNHPGHSTPSWIIIVGFIVGVAALVMLCVAIATRDKWNGPNQAAQVQAQTNSSNQQREVEMETFLHKDKPRENGKAAEYTVIPLDELPDNYSSH